ncbi:hypothetical protein [Microbispora sp. NPDC046933]
MPATSLLAQHVGDALPERSTAELIGRFTTAHQEHEHYEDGSAG